MAYCTTADIASEFKNLTVDATTPITSSEVTEYIDQVSNYMDGVIGVRYTVPVTIGTSPLSYSMLKWVCIQLVSQRVKKILRIKTGEENIDQETRADAKRAEEILKQIAKGDILLSDATVSNQNGYGWASYSESNSIDKVFDTKKQQW